MTPARDGRCLANRLHPFGEAAVVASPSRAVESKRETPASRNVLFLLVFLGIALRLVPLCQSRDLWIDEAMLALNLVDRSPAQLLEPLDWNQGAPVGFLLAVKATILLVGSSDWGLRFFPFLASLLGLMGFVWVARQMLPRQAAVLAATLFAINPSLISYSAECKQYAVDAAIAVGLLAASLGLLSGSGGFRRWAILSAAGATAVWFSHPASFVLGGLGTVLFLEAAYNRDRRRCLACSVVIVSWSASFAACYLLTMRHLGANTYLLDYWANHFLPLPPRSPGDVAWLADHFFGFFSAPGGLGGTEFRIGGIAALLSLVGVSAFASDRRSWAGALVLPALLALLASGLHKYPFAGRLLLFLVPFAILAVSRGAWELASVLWGKQSSAAILLVGLLVIAPLVETYQQMSRPQRHEQLTEVLAEIRTRAEPGDRVYLYYGGVPAFTYYTREEPFPFPVVLGEEHRSSRTAYRDELRKLAGERRVWLVFSHRHQAEESLLRAYAESIGECREEFRRPGAAAFRYDFSVK
jgi:hypothetical protein